MCLIWLGNTPMAGEPSFLCLSLRVCLEEISTGISRLSKEYPPFLILVGISQSIEGPNWTKMGGISNYLYWSGMIIFCFWTLEILVLGPTGSKKAMEFLPLLSLCLGHWSWTVSSNIGFLTSQRIGFFTELPWISWFSRMHTVYKEAS
jgi:hypothetical protein